MQKIIYTLLAVAACLSLRAVRIETVTARDLTPTRSQVVIKLSAPAVYSVQDLPGRKGLRVIVPAVSEFSGILNYPRLSKVIDTVNAFSDGNRGVVEIATMAAWPSTYFLSDDKLRIVVNINATQAANPKPKEAQSSNKLPAALPPASTIKDIPPATDTTAMQTVVKPETIKPVAKVSEPIKTKSMCIPLNSEQIVTWLTWLGAAVLVALLVMLLYQLLRKKPKPLPAARPEKKAETDGLHLDTETRNRMVGRLSDQGWTASEIAREIKLSEEDVEEIIARTKNNLDTDA